VAVAPLISEHVPLAHGSVGEQPVWQVVAAPPVRMCVVTVDVAAWFVVLVTAENATKQSSLLVSCV